MDKFVNMKLDYYIDFFVFYVFKAVYYIFFYALV